MIKHKHSFFTIFLLLAILFYSIAEAADKKAPSVLITSPSNNTTYTSAQTVTIAASASDRVGVTKVEFYDGTTLKGTDTSSPYTYSWSFTSADNGTHAWTAKAYDAAGNSSTSSTVNLTVNISAADTTPPTVSITSPSSGTTYTSAQTVTIYASASDNVGVTRVDFYDGGTYKGTDATSSYTYSWTFTSADNGTHSWTARAYDAAGNSSTSSVVSLTVNISTADTTPPTVSITSPSSGTTYTAAQTVTIYASASDNVGVTRVDFYDGGTYKGTDTTSSYTYSWTFTSADNGTHNWTARAYDAAGNSSTSSVASLTVNISSGTTPPVAPTNLTATAISSSQINLSWTDNATNEEGFHIWRYHSSVGWAQIAVVGANPITYQDTGLSPSTTYYYLVNAYNSAGTSGWSNVSAATTLSGSVTVPSAPSNLAASSASSSQINLSWTDNATNETGFKIERATSASGPFSQIAITAANLTTYQNTGLTASTTYYYRVCANNSAGDSSYSNTANAITQGPGTPPTGSVTINGGATYTNTASVTLTLSADDSDGVSQMCISNTGSCTAWQTYATSKAWTLTTGDGTKTVYVWYKDGAGNTSASCSDMIFLDTVPPQCSVIINNNVAYTNSTSVTLTLSASDPNPGSGVAQMCVNNANTSCSSWVTYGTSLIWTLPSGDGTKYVYAWFKDAAGNFTATPSTTADSIILDTTAPPVPSGLTATAVSSSQINLSWSAVVDTSGGSGLAGYKVYRSVTQIGTTTATSYSDYGLTANTQYCYRVASYDNIGNISGQCTQVCATTPSGSQPGAHIWSERFGSAGSDAGYSVAIDGSGNVIVAGLFMGTADFGGGSLTSSGSTYPDIFIAKYSAAGAHQWSKRIGGIGDEIPYGVAVDGSGNVVVTGNFTGTADFGGGSLTSAGSYDIFVAKYSPTGAHQWSKRFGDTTSDTGYSVAVDASGNIVVTGSFQNKIDFGGGLLFGNGGDGGFADAFVVKFSATGVHQWSRSFGGMYLDYGYDVAADGNGNVIVTGYFQGTADFGGGPLTSVNASSDVFIVKYSPTGSHLWSQRFGTSAPDIGYGVAVDGSNNIILTGQFQNTIDFGGGTLVGVHPSYPDIFIAKFSATGAHQWSRSFGGQYHDVPYGIAVDGSGNIVITGWFIGMTDLGGGSLASAGSYDIFVAKYTSGGSHLWSQSFGNTEADMGRAVAVDGSGNVVATGSFRKTVDFGGELLSCAGATDAFLVKFAP